MDNGFGDITHAKDAHVFCRDFGDFQQVLKNMRIIDDRIIYALNTAIPTASFASCQDPLGIDKCLQLSDELQQSYKEREGTIHSCVDYTNKRIQNLKDKPATEDTSRQLRKEQNTLRMMMSELNIEEVLRNRANKMLHDRCQFYLQHSGPGKAST